jgi:ABC-type transport system substrate-binding protein
LLGGISTAPKYDPVLAKRLYNEAGFSALNPAKVIAGCSNWEKPLTVLQFIQQELKKNLGLELTIQSYDHKTFRSQLDLGAFPMYLNSWSADFPDSDNFVSVFLSQGGNNRTSWKNLDFDAKVLKARHSQIPDERIKLYQESQRLLLTDDAVVVPLYHEPILSLVQPTVKNFNVNPLNETFLKDIVISVP